MAIEFRILKNKSDEIVGIEITGDGSTDAREYCGTFLTALIKEGLGDLRFSKGSIIFERENIYPPKVYSFQLQPTEYETLKKIIHPKNPKLKFEESIAWSGSLKIFVVEDE